MQLVDLTGETFGSLTVIERAPNQLVGKKKKSRVAWLCKCECGNEVEVTSLNLRSGNSKTCGCGKGLHKKDNDYKERDGYMVGISSNGQEFLFDKEDFEKVKDYCWRVTGGYVEAKRRKTGENVRFHRLVTGYKSQDVDHINRNPLDNRKRNLRPATRAQNNANAGLSKNNSSGVVGVHFDKTRKKWVAQIGVDYSNVNLGRFESKEGAVAARKIAELEYFGEYANQNY